MSRRVTPYHLIMKLILFFFPMCSCACAIAIFNINNCIQWRGWLYLNCHIVTWRRIYLILISTQYVLFNRHVLVLRTYMHSLYAHCILFLFLTVLKKTKHVAIAIATPKRTKMPPTDMGRARVRRVDAPSSL